MIIENTFSTVPERSLCDGRHLDAELECKRLLTLHRRSGKPNDMTVVTWLNSLAEALEAQDKYVEGLDMRRRAGDVLFSLVGTA